MIPPIPPPSTTTAVCSTPSARPRWPRSPQRSETGANPFDSLRIRRLGGALAQGTPASAVGRIEEPFLIFGVAIGTDDAVGEAVADVTAR